MNNDNLENIVQTEKNTNLMSNIYGRVMGSIYVPMMLSLAGCVEKDSDYVPIVVYGLLLASQATSQSRRYSVAGRNISND